MNNETRLACFELWGGNHSADHPVELPGLAGWVYSAPFDPGSGGGDIHYFSVCSKGMVSRIAVSGLRRSMPTLLARRLTRAHSMRIAKAS